MDATPQKANLMEVRGFPIFGNLFSCIIRSEIARALFTVVPLYGTCKIDGRYRDCD
jgi:hypothetical protein